MIISFYPGSGGNRFYQMLQGNTSFAPATTYDHLLKKQPFEYRYVDNNSQLADNDLILTHCVNVPLLQRLFPNHREIIVIQSNLDSGLRREWELAGRHRQNRSVDPVEDALASISFHYKYYQEFPLDTQGATQVIDIDNDTSEFAVMMLQELSTVTSTEFDQALIEFKTMPAHNITGQSGDKVVDGYKSKFLYDAESIKREFDKMNNPAICLAKWKQVSLHLPTGLNNSCYHPPLHTIPIEAIQKNPAALHNTDYKKEQRRRMLNGERPEECSYCWAMEDQNKLSDRHYRSAEPWAYKDFGKIISSDYTDDIIPSYVEVNFNNACNLKCSYCSPQFSSSWADEANRDGAYATSTPHNAPEHFTGARRVIPARKNNPYVEAFWQWWPTLYPELEHFRMTGGEPLMDRNTYRVFDYVLANPSPRLHLNVTSNFSVEDALFEKYLGYVKQLCTPNIEHFMQYVSLDSGSGPQAEYIRHGMSADRVVRNVNRYLTEVPTRNSLTFIITMNNLSVTGFQAYMEWILHLRRTHSTTYQRVWFDTPVLREPAWQSLQILPESYVVQLEQARDYMLQNMETPSDPFHGFKDYEVQRLERDIAWMRAKQGQDHSAARADFYRFFSEHDRRRGTDFLKTFPEMRSWWAECEYHARQT